MDGTVELTRREEPSKADEVLWPFVGTEYLVFLRMVGD